MRHKYALMALCAGLWACTRPPPETPGVEQQPVFHPERSIATMPSLPAPYVLEGPAESDDDPDSPGTVRTPPGPPAAPMDDLDPQLAAGR
jgi:hypothetical protein